MCTQAQIAEKQRRRAVDASDKHQDGEAATLQELQLKAKIELALSALPSNPHHNRRKFDW